MYFRFQIFEFCKSAENITLIVAENKEGIKKEVWAP